MMLICLTIIIHKQSCTPCQHLQSSLLTIQMYWHLPVVIDSIFNKRESEVDICPEFIQQNVYFRASSSIQIELIPCQVKPLLVEGRELYRYWSQCNSTGIHSPWYICQSFILTNNTPETAHPYNWLKDIWIYTSRLNHDNKPWPQAYWMTTYSTDIMYGKFNILNRKSTFVVLKIIDFQ